MTDLFCTMAWWKMASKKGLWNARVEEEKVSVTADLKQSAAQNIQQATEGILRETIQRNLKVL